MFYLTHANGLAVYDSSDGSYTRVTRKVLQEYLMRGVQVSGARLTKDGKLKTSPLQPEIIANGLRSEEACGIPVVWGVYQNYLRY